MGKRIRLGVNIDHVATLRQARGTRYPDVAQAAQWVIQAGADLITVHLREDRRHIQDRDVELLRELLHVPLNLECAVTDEMLSISERVKPDWCCLVPEKREELTTEGGLDVAGQQAGVAAACSRLLEQNIQVSLFIDPEPAQIEAAAACGAVAVELHTGTYADAGRSAQANELQRLREAAIVAEARGLAVHAGHGLHHHNVLPVAELPQIVELNIGHALIARAVFTGLTESVSSMRALMDQAR